MLARIVLLLFSLALVLAVGEIGVRLFLSPPQRTDLLDADVAYRLAAEKDRPLELSIRPGDRPGATWQSDTLYVATPTGARLRSNTVAEIRSHRVSKRDTVVRTNSLGYRNPEIGPKTRRRVLFLGDSITFGDWLPEDETFVRRIEALSQGSLETINAGVGAIGLETELAILLETGLGVDPDVVVLGFYLNDAEPSRGVQLLAVPAWLGGSWLARHTLRLVSFALLEKAEQPEVAWRRRLAQAEGDLEGWKEEIARSFPPGRGSPRREPAAFNRVIGKSVDSWGRAWSSSTWDAMEPTFFELARQAELHDFELLIVGFPVFLQVEADFVHDYPQQQLARIARKVGVPLLDLLPLLRELHRSGDQRLFYDRCHHTAYGNARIAEALLAFIQEAAPAR